MFDGVSYVDRQNEGLGLERLLGHWGQDLVFIVLLLEILLDLLPLVNLALQAGNKDNDK